MRRIWYGITLILTELKKYWFAFKDDGTLVESDWSKIGLASYAETFNKTNPPEIYAYYKDGGYQSAGWVQADYDGSGSAHDTKWFYLDNKGVPFNYASTVATGANAGSTAEEWDGAKGEWKAEIKNVAAKVIKNKTYLFNEYGEMLTGVYRVHNAYRVGNPNNLGQGTAKVYYFDTEEATAGAMAQNKKVPVTSNDVTYNYCFDSNGAAAENEIVNGTLYGNNGIRVDAEDMTWQVKTVAEISPNGIKSDKKETVKKADGSTVTQNVQLTTSDTYQCTTARVIVNANGRVKESGTVIIDGVKYWVKSASEADSGVKGGIDGKAYMVVMEKSIDN